MTSLRLLSFSVLALLGAAAATPAPAAQPTPDPDNGGITLPPGFRAVVFADGLAAPRFLAVAPNGDVYARQRRGGIAALRDTDGDGRADQREIIPTDGAGSGVAIHDGHLYFSSDTAVFRQKRAPDELVPAAPVETIVSGLPDRYQSPRPQHETKAFAFDDQGHMLVEIGSPSNALGNPDRGPNAGGSSPEVIAEFLAQHGGFWRFDAARTGQTQADGVRFSTGHRHMLSLAWHPVSRAFFACQNGRDVLNVVNPGAFDAAFNAERVAEEFHVVREGSNFGWPTTYYDPIARQRVLAPEYGGDGNKEPEPGRFQDPLIAFPAHWAPMQMTIYSGTQFPARYRGGAFIAFHGSWNRAPLPQRGYNVCFVPFDERGLPRGSYEIFADHFAGREELTNPRDARFRPQGVAVGPDGSLYIGADQGGRIWRVFHTGE